MTLPPTGGLGREGAGPARSAGGAGAPSAGGPDSGYGNGAGSAVPQRKEKLLYSPWAFWVGASVSFSGAGSP